MAKIRFEGLYPFPKAQVWIALTDPEAMAEWLMPNDFRAELGHRFTFRTQPAPGFDGIVQCELLVLEPHDRLAYSWKGGGIDTIVRWTLEDHGGSTRVIMEQDGFTGVRGLMVSQLLKGGWKRMIDGRLPAAVARVSDGAYRPDPESPESRCHG
jgi:uncharacterized protein YndB with AHSA1/START domain